MKQTINVGQSVDDGTGDYLRQGSIKTRDNINEIYSNLGDGSVLYASGAWRKWKFASEFLNGDTSWISANSENYYDEYGDGSGPALHANFGEAWTIDTSNGSVNVHMPPGVEEADYGKSIRIRDVKGNWDKNTVTVYPNQKDSIKRIAGASSMEVGVGAEFKYAFQDLELVFTPPRHWEYVAQKYVNGLTFGDVPSVLRRALLSRQGQRDYNMSMELGGGQYNKLAVELYRRGNLMYHGDVLNDYSDFGSVPLHTVPAWIPSNPDVYHIGELVRGDASTGRDDRVWQCISEHNSIGAWETNKWEEFEEFPDYQPHATSTEYNNGDIVVKTYDGFIQTFECSVSHTSSASDTDLRVDSNWNQLTNDDLAPLDGRTLRLRLPASAGDPVAMVTYISDVSSFRSSYVLESVKIVDEKDHNAEAVSGYVVKKDLVDGMTLSLVEFGLAEYTQYNAATFELLLNGTQLTRSNSAGMSDSFSGEPYDYDHIQDADGKWNTIKFGKALENNDIVTVRWYDNVIGTLLSWDEGEDNIESRTRDICVSRDGWADVRRFNSIIYTDIDEPSALVTEVNADPETLAPAATLTSLLESIYPIGSIYTNANNPNNPSDFMGFGTWNRFAEGRVAVGWNSVDDGVFHRNNNNSNIVQAGGTGGTIGITLTSENIPELISTSNVDYTDEAERDIGMSSEQYSLVARSAAAGGAINLNGCLGDPDNTTPLAYYAEEPIKVNHGQVANSFSITQPFITVYTWVRTS